MGSDAAPAAPPPLPPHPSEQLPQQPVHAKKASIEDLFENRWRKAYEVRALERESRQGKSQGGSGPGSTDVGAGGDASPDTGPALTPSQQQPQQKQAEVTAPVLDMQAAVGSMAAAALEKLSLSDDGSGGSTQQAAASLPDETRRVQPQEVIDDDDEEEGVQVGAGCEVANGGGGGAKQQPAPTEQLWPGHNGEGSQDHQKREEQEAGADLDCQLVWDSSSVRRGKAAQPRPGSAGAASGLAAELKERGNAHLKAGEFEAAVRCYTQGLVACGQAALGAARAGGVQGRPRQHQQQQQQQQQAGEATAAGQGGSGAAAASASPADHHLLATLHSNRAHALLKLKRNHEAAADALQAHHLFPTWTKPLYRLAQAQLALGQWAAAVGSCKAGEALEAKNSEGHTDFTPLLDRVAVHAARAGSLVGFDGQQLEVRSAGEEAWLGRPAPYVPELDGPEDEDTHGPVTTLPLALPASGSEGATSGPQLASTAGGGTTAAGVDPLVSWDYRQTVAVRQRRRTSFRSIKEAVTAARDGDRILLLKGVHNGMGESVNLTKRLLIEAEGVLGEVTIDQRANCPMFRISRGGVVIRGVDLDQTGFREALLVDGASSVHPLIHGCSIKCSGDDAVNTRGAAAPTFARCIITGKKVGVKAFGRSAPRLEQCSIEKCGEQGVRAMDEAAPLLYGCAISECGEEAALAMDSARLTLHTCSLQDCKGPGVDLSGTARAAVTGGSVAQCVGGIWAWENARAVLRGTTVAGGPSHALLADGEAELEVRDSMVRGSVHATDAAWAGILHPSNQLADPDQPTDFPPEEGPFRFVPDRFTRKQ